MRFAFIAENKHALPVSRLCEIMDVSPRGYRAYCARPLSDSRHKDLVVLAHIREQFALSLGSYGRPRMTEELKEASVDVGHRRSGETIGRHVGPRNWQSLNTSTASTTPAENTPH